MPDFSKSAHKAPKSSAASTLPIEGAPNWVFVWRPDGFEVVTVDGVDRWAPKLRRFKLIKGVNGIKESGDTSLWLSWLRSNGWHMLENDPNESSPMHYADRYSARQSSTGLSTVMIDRWTEIRRYGNKVRLHTSAEAKAAFDAWRVGLVDSGTVDPPDEILCEDIADDYERSAVHRLMSKPTSELIAARIERNKAHLTRMRGAHRTAPVAPKAKGARRG